LARRCWRWNHRYRIADDRRHANCRSRACPSNGPVSTSGRYVAFHCIDDAGYRSSAIRLSWGIWCRTAQTRLSQSDCRQRVPDGAAAVCCWFVSGRRGWFSETFNPTTDRPIRFSATLCVSCESTGDCTDGYVTTVCRLFKKHPVIHQRIAEQRHTPKPLFQRLWRACYEICCYSNRRYPSDNLKPSRPMHRTFSFEPSCDHDVTFMRNSGDHPALSGAPRRSVTTSGHSTRSVKHFAPVHTTKSFNSLAPSTGQRSVWQLRVP
jgi:hypothetical protein